MCITEQSSANYVAYLVELCERAHHKNVADVVATSYSDLLKGFGLALPVLITTVHSSLLLVLYFGFRDLSTEFPKLQNYSNTRSRNIVCVEAEDVIMMLLFYRCWRHRFRRMLCWSDGWQTAKKLLMFWRLGRSLSRELELALESYYLAPSHAARWILLSSTW